MSLPVPVQEKMPVLREQKPPRKRSSRKLLWFLFLLFIVLLAVLFFRSSISKVETIDITGEELLQEDAIRQALGVAPGDHFFGFRSAALENRIERLPIVQEAHVTKRFPGLVRIQVQEYGRVAYEFSSEGKLTALLANGLVVPSASQAFQPDKPILTGWGQDNAWKLKLCQALAAIPQELLLEISEITPSPSATYEDKIKLYTRSQYEVYTTVTYLPDKLPYLEQIIGMMKEKDVESGVFELLEADRHVPFEQYYNVTPTPSPSPGKDAKKAG
ncbi:cell division protein FtsQ/DivIB [Paenibacillus koleovorans]|uniref:cell division protein FtsQ/DivIB n=1 Tax=Paenibacillus koleovorans TaxID=121608 RepID=UPI0013E3EB80|nr:FtsQ-type POTRA domain-containing protein [Paenibacillus koleovorans]